MISNLLHILDSPASRAITIMPCFLFPTPLPLSPLLFFLPHFSLPFKSLIPNLLHCNLIMWVSCDSEEEKCFHVTSHLSNPLPHFGQYIICRLLHTCVVCDWRAKLGKGSDDDGLWTLNKHQHTCSNVKMEKHTFFWQRHGPHVDVPASPHLISLKFHLGKNPLKLVYSRAWAGSHRQLWRTSQMSS